MRSAKSSQNLKRFGGGAIGKVTHMTQASSARSQADHGCGRRETPIAVNPRLAARHVAETYDWRTRLTDFHPHAHGLGANDLRETLPRNYQFLAPFIEAPVCQNTNIQAPSTRETPNSNLQVSQWRPLLPPDKRSGLLPPPQASRPLRFGAWCCSGAWRLTPGVSPSLRSRDPHKPTIPPKTAENRTLGWAKA
jgi:hypothetical protein